MKTSALEAAPLVDPTTAEEVRSSLWAPSTRRLLHDTVASLLSSHPSRLELDVRRVKCKPGRKLTATYDLSIDGRPDRPVTVTWFAPGEAGRAFDAADDDLEEEARRRGVAAPFRRLTASVPELGLRVQVSPYDPDFAQLVRLVDPVHVGAILEARLGWGRDGVAVRSVRYRPGQRHVLRYDGPDRGDAAVFAKLHRGDGARTMATAAAVAELLAGHRSGVTAAAPVASLDEDGVVLSAQRPGPALSELICLGASLGPHLRRAGLALRRLHEAPAALAEGAPVRDLAAEAAVTRRSSAYVGSLLPALGARIGVVLDRIALHAGDAPLPAVFAHGDFKADHLLVAGDTMTLIDFDSCAVAEPTLDLGKFLADLRYWFSAAGRAGVERAQRDFVAGYGDVGQLVDRARCYEAVFLLRAAARRVSLADADWAARTTALVGAAGAIMGEGRA